MQFGVHKVGNLVILHFILPLKFLFLAPSHLHHSHLTPQVHNRRREEGVFCTSDSGSHPSHLFLPLHVPSVHPQRPGSSEYPAIREQRGKDL